MGREVRRVPENWVHPIDESKNHPRPLHDEDYDTAIETWWAGREAWKVKPHEGFEDCTYEDYEGNAPQPECYRPKWKEEERTHLQMYETCSEGTPISPVMKTSEELARWLADNKASAFGSMTATYEQWLATIKRGWSPSGVFSGGSGLVSGVEGMAEIEST